MILIKNNLFAQTSNLRRLAHPAFLIRVTIYVLANYPKGKVPKDI